MKLSVQIEFDKTMDLSTAKTSVVVGRSPKCDLVIPHEAVSRQHCKIDLENGRFYITDLGSSNGVLIDGEKIEPNVKRAVISTSQLSFGTLQFELSETVNEQANSKLVQSSTSQNGDFTATVRLARLELNKPSVTLELEKKPILKKGGVRNPISSPKKNAPKPSNLKKPFLVILALFFLGLAWFLGDK